jgi:hypothetical protein
MQRCISRAAPAPAEAPRAAGAAARPAAAAAPPPLANRRALLAGLGALALGAAMPAQPAAAAGLERIPLPPPPSLEALAEAQARSRARAAEADAFFESSEFLRVLRERSEANAPARKKALTDLYCKRQSEIGVGDCAGLRLIPGATKSGVQIRPEWMDKLGGLLGGGE